MTFVLEEPFFSFNSATISDEFPGFPDNPMTRYDDDDRIVVVGSSYSPDSFWVAYHRCFLEIVSRFPIGYVFEGFPCFLLKLCSMGHEWYREVFSSSGKVFRELFFSLSGNSVFSLLQRLLFEIFYLFYLFVELF